MFSDGLVLDLRHCHCFRRLREKKSAERLAVRARYRSTMERIFSLEHSVDLAALRLRPSAEFLSFLQTNSAPDAVLREVRNVRAERVTSITVRGTACSPK